MHTPTLLPALGALLWPSRTPGSRTVKMAYCEHNRLPNTHFKLSRKLNRKTFPSTCCGDPTYSTSEAGWPTINPLAPFQTYLYMTVLQLTAFSVASYCLEAVETLGKKTVSWGLCETVWLHRQHYFKPLLLASRFNVMYPNTMFGWRLLSVCSPRPR